MSNYNSKKISIILIIAVLFLFLGSTYAFIANTLTGTKKVTITAGTLSLVLDEKNEITISDALPMYDQVGMIQEDVFNFDLINTTSNETGYKIKLQKISTDNELQTSDVKYYLTKDGVGEPALLSTLTDGIIDTGIIEGSDTINYTLRLWISDTVTDKTLIAGKSLSYKLVVEASMVEEKELSFVDTLEDKVDTSTVVDFTSISSDTNGRGIYKYQEDDEDIYYFRGKVEDNHVLFAGYCWEIVRTTKTGGIKMIYDGVPVESNGLQSCTNSYKNAVLFSDTMEFNTNYNDNAHVGYMYGLTGVRTEPASAQCIKLNSAGTQAEVATESTQEECVENGGKWATTAYESTHANVVNSTIKTAIDTWFSTSNLNTKENLEKLEDTVYCNDRSIDQTAGSAQNWSGYTTLGYGRNYTVYSATARVGYNVSNPTPSLECSNVNDRFTVSSENGNGDLTYPVGMLTIDEVVLAGGVYGQSNGDYYLRISAGYWGITPMAFLDTGDAWGFNIKPYGDLNTFATSTKSFVRPVVSLVPGTAFVDGTDGTVNNPYILK